MAFGGLALHYILFSILRLVQIVLSLTVCGLYGVDLHSASAQGKYQDSKWLYAVVVGGMSAVTAMLYCIPFILRLPLAFIWDAIISLLWIALFGIFGQMYIQENPEGDAGIQRMKNAVWVDLTNVFLWLISMVAMTVHWQRLKRSRKSAPGRAQV